MPSPVRHKGSFLHPVRSFTPSFLPPFVPSPRRSYPRRSYPRRSCTLLTQCYWVLRYSFFSPAPARNPYCILLTYITIYPPLPTSRRYNTVEGGWVPIAERNPPSLDSIRSLERWARRAYSRKAFRVPVRGRGFFGGNFLPFSMLLHL